jgi:protein-L-isoaspartate(D-aspartate) O-methyltransferase
LSSAYFAMNRRRAIMDLNTRRAAFAEELRYVAHVRSDRVITAFATVPRECFLGAPPWHALDLYDGTYWDVPGVDPASLYHNVIFAIDAARTLNNGQPEFWARLLDRLEIRGGDSVYHIGAGVGYYTAIMAELAGPDGKVVAAEIDPELAMRARANLAARPNVEVVAADGSVTDPGMVDVIVVNAGATHPMPAWLGALMPGGAPASAADCRQWARFGVPRRASAGARRLQCHRRLRRPDLSMRRCSDATK